MLEIVYALLKDLDAGKGRMPPTHLYNEGWLLRAVMHWFSKNRDIDHPLACLPGADWFSEGLLYTRFLPQHRGDRLGESYTRADGVMGHIGVGSRGTGDIYLAEPFQQFNVLEAKLFSPLSPGTTNTPGYDQVSRSIACMAAVMSESKCFADDFSSLGFYVLAPEKQLESDPAFYEFIDKTRVYDTVLARVEMFKERSNYMDKQIWFEYYFKPLHSKIEMLLLSWEELLFDIKRHDSETGKGLARFYEQCLAYNQPDKKGSRLFTP